MQLNWFTNVTHIIVRYCGNVFIDFSTGLQTLKDGSFHFRKRH